LGDGRKEDGVLRTMAADKLLKTIPVLQSQIDALLEFDCSANDLTNGVVNTAFLLLFRDLIRLFACYNDGIINLLEKYFDMNKKQCKDALDFYKKFLVRMDRVAEFLKVAENVGIDKGDIPDLTKAPSSLLEALEAHLATLEGKKPTTTSTSNISLAQHNGAMAANAEQIDESLKRQALAEEEAAMNQYKKSTNPFLSSPTAATATPVSGAAAPATAQQQQQQQPILDLFGEELDGGATSAGASAAGGFNGQASTQKASDDLLQLAANPFASPTGATPPIPPLPANSTWSSTPQNGGFGSQFASDNSFASAFSNAKSTNGFDAFGDLLQPGANATGASAMAGPAVPQPSAASQKVITGDLESSLASLAQNLTINKTQSNKTQQWSQGTAKAAAAAPGQQPLGAPQWGMQPMMAMQGQMAYRPMQPMMPMTSNAPMAPMTAMTTPLNPMMASGIRPMMSSTGAPFQMGGMTQPMAVSGMRPAANQQLDPFGAL